MAETLYSDTFKIGASFPWQQQLFELKEHVQLRRLRSDVLDPKFGSQKSALL